MKRLTLKEARSSRNDPSRKISNAAHRELLDLLTSKIVTNSNLKPIVKGLSTGDLESIIHDEYVDRMGEYKSVAFFIKKCEENIAAILIAKRKESKSKREVPVAMIDSGGDIEEPFEIPEGAMGPSSSLLDYFRQAWNDLTKEEKMIFSLHYGVDGGEPLTIKEVLEELMHDNPQYLNTYGKVMTKRDRTRLQLISKMRRLYSLDKDMQTPKNYYERKYDSSLLSYRRGYPNRPKDWKDSLWKRYGEHYDAYKSLVFWVNSVKEINEFAKKSHKEIDEYLKYIGPQFDTMQLKNPSKPRKFEDLVRKKLYRDDRLARVWSNRRKGDDKDHVAMTFITSAESYLKGSKGRAEPNYYKENQNFFSDTTIGEIQDLISNLSKNVNKYFVYSYIIKEEKMNKVFDEVIEICKNHLDRYYIFDGPGEENTSAGREKLLREYRSAM